MAHEGEALTRTSRVDPKITASGWKVVPPTTFEQAATRGQLILGSDRLRSTRRRVGHAVSGGSVGHWPPWIGNTSLDESPTRKPVREISATVVA